MSLDVYLTGEPSEVTCHCVCGNEHKREAAPHYYSSNITHNLNEMAKAAGIYKELWRPEEIGVTKAFELIKPLTAGLARLEKDPAKYSEFNAPNGWGRFEHLVMFVSAYIEACRNYPESFVKVSR
jgi:hypothetical protein